MWLYKLYYVSLLLVIIVQVRWHRCKVHKLKSCTAYHNNIVVLVFPFDVCRLHFSTSLQGWCTSSPRHTCHFISLTPLTWTGYVTCVCVLAMFYWGWQLWEVHQSKLDKYVLLSLQTSVAKGPLILLITSFLTTFSVKYINRVLREKVRWLATGFLLSISG